MNKNTGILLGALAALVLCAVCMNVCFHDTVHHNDSEGSMISKDPNDPNLGAYEGDYSYRLVGHPGDNIEEWFSYGTHTLVLEGHGKMYENYKLRYDWCQKHKDDIEKVIIGPNIPRVQTIFLSCMNLKEVIVKGDSIEVGYDAFNNCQSLESFPFDKVTYIDQGAFMGCKSLNVSSLKLNLSFIGYNAFSYTSIESVVVNTYTFDADAFVDCSSLKHMEINAKRMDYGFSTLEVSPLETVKISGSADICKNLFKDCKSLKSVEITEHIKIGNGAFEGCTSLENVIFHKHVDISWDVFKGCTSLKALAFDMVDSIGDYAFKNSGLESAKVTGGCSKHAFEGCTHLKTIAFDIDTISANHYDDFKELKTVLLGKSVKVIGERAFEGCTSLETARLFGDSIAVEDYAFRCSGLESFPTEKIIKLGEHSFENTYITYLTVNKVITSIPAFAFEGCSRLKTVDIEGTVSIGDWAFHNCYSLESLPDNITDIGKRAFSQCGMLGLKTLVIKAPVRTIGEEAFFNSGSEGQKLEIGDSVVSIGKNAFTTVYNPVTKDHNPKFFSISFGNGLETIDDLAFGYEFVDAHGEKITSGTELREHSLYWDAQNWKYSFFKP